MKIRRINVVDPGSVKTVSDKPQAGNSYCDKIGIGERNHEPIGACYVAGWLKKQGLKVNTIFPHSDNLSVAEVLEGNPQIIGFSCLTYNYPIVNEIAKRIQAKRPEIILVVGGYHATCVPKQVSKAKGYDGYYLFLWVVAQEADWTLGDIVEYYNGKRCFYDIRGKFYFRRTLCNNFSRFNPNLNPIPLRTKEIMIGRNRQGLYYPPPSQQKSVGLFVWSRGCPYNCEFCISAKMFPSCANESPVKYREIENIIEEVEFCQKEFGTNFGFAVDLNLYGGDKKRVRELCSELGKTGLKWNAMSRLDVDLELFEIMKMGGCTQIGFGVESLINQRKSGAGMDIVAWRQKAKEVAKYMRRLGVLSKFFYILGGPGETLENIRAEGEAICDVDCDEIRLSWMMLSPGTPLFKKLKQAGGLEKNGRDLSLFSTDYPVIRVPGVDAEKLQKLRLGIYRKFYSPKRYGSRAVAMVKAFPHLKQSFEEWNVILKQSLGKGWKEE